MHRFAIITCTSALLGVPNVLSGQTSRAVPSAFAKVSDIVSDELSGQRALRTVAFVEQFFRLPGNRGFDASIDTVARLLEIAGYVPENRARATDRLVYRVESRPMPAAAWTPDSASLAIVGRAGPLLRWSTNHNMVAINSEPTPAGGVTANVVDVGAGTDAEFGKTSVKGRIVFTTGSARSVFPRAMQNGAVGVLAAQKLPAYNQQVRNVQAIQFSSIPRDSVHKGWLIFLSAAATDSMRAALAHTANLQAHVMIAARFETRPERTVVAEIRGSRMPAERFVYSAHVQEPGANDNASGVGLLAEMARTAALLVRTGRSNPARTLTFLWGDEIRSTARFLAEDSTRRRGVKWGMSLDMVGENTALTGGTFLIEKMPDPSAVWVRGEDQHSEWGATPIGANAIRPHWYNDFVRQRCLDRAARTNWIVKSNPFEGGSDHTPFLDANIPAVLLWHFTDQHYHTDLDRIGMVSDATLANVGNCALSTGLLLTSADGAVARAALDELVRVAEQALATQATLSTDTIAKGASIMAERKVLETWRDYYVGAIARITEIGSVDSATISGAQEKVRNRAAQLIGSLR